MYLAQYYADKQVEAYKKDMESKLNPIFEERQTQSFIDTAKSKFPDFYEYKDKVGEEIDIMSLNEPELLSDPRVYEIAYMRAKVKTLEEKSKTAFENGKKATQVKEQSKKQIVNETSKASKEEDTLPPGVTLMPEGDGIFF
jgi:hypothetical protein